MTRHSSLNKLRTPVLFFWVITHLNLWAIMLRALITLLPTNGFAKTYSGVSLDSFFKKITFQQLTKRGLQNISKAVTTLADAEGLQAHANAVSIRLP
jgi:hypothetical protein